MKAKKRILIGIPFFILIFIYGGWNIYHRQINMSNEYDKLSKEFEHVFIEDSINNKVLSTYYPEDWAGGLGIQYIKLENGEAYKIHTNNIVINSKTIWFGNVIREGVYLRKDSGSDLLIIDNGNKKYCFNIIFEDTIEDKRSFIEKILNLDEPILPDVKQ